MWQISKSGRIDRLVVFVHLPEGPTPVGALFFEGNGRARSATFAYAKSWLARPARFPIVPAALSLKSAQHAGRPYEAPLPFYDAAPDGWGKSILAAAYPHQEFDLGEYLAATGDERTGYLAFGPTPDSGPGRWAPEGTPLLTLPDGEETIEDIFDAVVAVEAGEARPHHLHRLVRHSADQGGVRPKACVWYNDYLHIAKFPAREDAFDDPKVEGSCLTLARLAGMDVPDHETLPVGSKTVLLVKRFDRATTGERLGYTSAGTLMKAEPNAYYSDVTYADIAIVSQRQGVAPCAREIYRRMLFNCFIHNTDEHLRNHGFIRENGRWRLSPAFDLTVHRPERLVLSPAKGISPAANPATAFHAHHHFGLPPAEAKDVYEEIVAAMARIPEVLDQHEVTAKDRGILAGHWTYALNPPAISAAVAAPMRKSTHPQPATPSEPEIS